MINRDVTPEMPLRYVACPWMSVCVCACVCCMRVWLWHRYPSWDHWLKWVIQAQNVWIQKYWNNWKQICWILLLSPGCYWDFAKTSLDRDIYRNYWMMKSPPWTTSRPFARSLHPKNPIMNPSLCDCLKISLVCFCVSTNHECMDWMWWDDSQAIISCKKWWKSVVRNWTRTSADPWMQGPRLDCTKLVCGLFQQYLGEIPKNSALIITAVASCKDCLDMHTRDICPSNYAFWMNSRVIHECSIEW